MIVDLQAKRADILEFGQPAFSEEPGHITPLDS
jgi:hypothetical protein